MLPPGSQVRGEGHTAAPVEFPTEVKEILTRCDPARPGGARRTDAGPLSSDASGAMALSPRGSLGGAAGADVSGPLVCRVSPPVYPEPEVFTGFLGAPRSHPARAHRPRQRPLSRTASARSGQAGSSAPAGAEWDVADQGGPTDRPGAIHALPGTSGASACLSLAQRVGDNGGEDL